MCSVSVKGDGQVCINCMTLRSSRSSALIDCVAYPTASINSMQSCEPPWMSLVRAIDCDQDADHRGAVRGFEAACKGVREAKRPKSNG